MTATQVLIAGFGGQGILFAGKFLAYAGLLMDKQVSWLPSYGPEMRGGTANCSVILSDAPIGSPIVHRPDILMAMNLPSLERYLGEAAPGASVFYDSSLIPTVPTREGISLYPIPATALADDNGLKGLANMILMGHMLAKTALIPDALVTKAMEKVVSARHAELLDKNLTAIRLGYTY